MINKPLIKFPIALIQREVTNVLVYFKVQSLPGESLFWFDLDVSRL